MQYPLPENIGNPDLLVGREWDTQEFDKWLSRIPEHLSKSRVILARRKSGKTAFVQRIFNKLWSENGKVIPFYLDIPEKFVWYPHFGIRYFQNFASQFISFIERDEELVRNPMTLEKIREYGVSKSIDPLVTDVDEINRNMLEEGNDLLWEIAYTAPVRYAGVMNFQFLVILDEFQNINQYVYLDQEFKYLHKTLAGSYHSVSESKLAPMLVTGSYVGWLIQIMSKYLQAGRLKQIYFTPYLTPEEGLQAVYKYSEIYREPVTNETAVMINQLCFSDPFFISCVIQSRCPGRDLTTAEGVIETVHFEVTHKKSELSMTWGEYLELTLKRINDIHAKNILLHLTKNTDREWTPKEIKETLGIDLSTNEIHERLRIMVEADVIEEGGSDIRYRGLNDGTLNLILRDRFEEEIQTFSPDFRKDFHEEIKRLKKEKKSLQGMLNHLTGKFAEFQLVTEFQTRKRFALSEFFDGVNDRKKLNITDARMRVKFQRPDGKELEIDVMAASDCGRVVLVEVKKTADKTGVQMIRDFQEKVEAFQKAFPKNKVLPAFFSTGGFTGPAKGFCRKNTIGTAERVRFGGELLG